MHSHKKSLQMFLEGHCAVTEMNIGTMCCFFSERYKIFHIQCFTY